MCKGNIKPVIGTKNVYVVDQFEKAISIFSEKKNNKKEIDKIWYIFFTFMFSYT